MLETEKYTHFIFDFVQANKGLNPRSESFAKAFSNQYESVSMMAFPDSTSAAFRDTESEIFVMKAQRPHNAIQVYEYDFVLNSISCLYEIPLSEEKLSGVHDL